MNAVGLRPSYEYVKRNGDIDVTMNKASSL